MYPVWPARFADSTGAELSPCEQYRYALWRKWDSQLPPLVFLMLNPSTADKVDNDRTITQCIGFARREGTGGIIVANIFAFRSPDPASLYLAPDPVGPENDHWLEVICQYAPKIVAAWGNEAIAQDRATFILSFLKSQNIPLYCLGKNKNGSPKHPVRLPHATPLIPYP